jgi:hypothetical protein
LAKMHYCKSKRLSLKTKSISRRQFKNDLD